MERNNADQCSCINVMGFCSLLDGWDASREEVREVSCSLLDIHGKVHSTNRGLEPNKLRQPVGMPCHTAARNVEPRLPATNVPGERARAREQVRRAAI